MCYGKGHCWRYGFDKNRGMVMFQVTGKRLWVRVQRADGFGLWLRICYVRVGLG